MQNPSDKYCFQMCKSCYRCADRGSKAECQSCSGRHDPDVKRYPDPDDYCDCRNGILRYRLQNGRLIIQKFHHNPFGGKVTSEAQTADERDWQSFLNTAREKLDDPNWDPIQFVDGESTDKWLNKRRSG